MNRILYFILAMLLFSCQGNSSKLSEEAIPTTEAIVSEPPAPDTANLIVPGERIGQFSLGITTEELSKQAGRADSGDAAMGKSLQFWFTDQQKPGYVAAFGSRSAGSAAGPQVVRLVQTTSPTYKTAEGIGVKAALSDVRKHYPKLKPVAYYSSKPQQQVYIFDDQAKGIAFEIGTSDSICVAISIHPKQEAFRSTYLPLYPGFVTLQE